MTNEQYEILKQEIQKPEYSGKSDEEVAEMLNALTAEGRDSTLYTTRKIMDLAILSGLDYNALMAKLDAAATGNQLLIDALEAMRTYPEGGGLDFSTDSFRIMLDKLLSNNVITQEERDLLYSIGVKKISVAESLGLPKVYPGHVASARSLLQ